MVPISATITTREWQERAFGTMERFDLHGSTYAGNALACRTAMAVLELMDEEKLTEASKTRGGKLIEMLKAGVKGHPLVRDVRGRGLFVGIELGPTEKGGLLHRALPGVVEAVSRRIFGQWLAVRLLERGIVAQPASQQWNVLKLEPPLTVSDEEITRVVTEVSDLLDDYRDVGPIVKDAAERLGKQMTSGWRFG